MAVQWPSASTSSAGRSPARRARSPTIPKSTSCLRPNRAGVGQDRARASPGPALEPRLVAEARGAADSVALRLRYHDAKLHARTAPADPDARAVFDALETARVEALGAPRHGRGHATTSPT